MFFAHAPKQSELLLDVSDIPYDSLVEDLKYAVSLTQRSPFEIIREEATIHDLPARLPNPTIHTLSVDVSLSVIEKRRYMSFWNLQAHAVTHNGKSIPIPECVVVMDTSKYFDCELIAKMFMANKRGLNVYINNEHQGTKILADILLTLCCKDQLKYTDAYKHVLSYN